MTDKNPSLHLGLVVDHLETGVRYAISEENFNPKVHKRVRELVPGETVRSYRPKAAESLAEIAEASEAAAPKDTQTPAKPTTGSQASK